ncbi:hypothetical protein EYF80_025082 [Liparis tanakae]|uniref:Uncharacterized protein n=1 Tax=Liparis tanakae TaxID=230148 RepID=A0A4Z2HHD1_9TELE|nr:hypothetical protein EYF80_025082 [Liparis tanakae]
MRPYEAAGTPRWPRVEVRYQLSSLGARPMSSHTGQSTALLNRPIKRAFSSTTLATLQASVTSELNTVKTSITDRP